MRSANRIWIIVVLVALIVRVRPQHLGAQASVAAGGLGQTSLEEMLNADGRPDLASGFRGSVDARESQKTDGRYHNGNQHFNERRTALLDTQKPVGPRTQHEPAPIGHTFTRP